jgi:hypothetical protein
MPPWGPPWEGDPTLHSRKRGYSRARRPASIRSSSVAVGGACGLGGLVSLLRILLPSYRLRLLTCRFGKSARAGERLGLWG